MEQLSLLPSRPFWVVRLGAGWQHYGPFRTERMAEWFAATHGPPTSNFVIPVLPPERKDG